jgi:hypothetical protein
MAIKENGSPAVSLYERRKARRGRGALIFVLSLVVFLLAVYSVNLFLHWTVTRLELAEGPVFQSPDYSFFGFSLFNRKEIAAVRYFENSSRPTRVFGFFDFFHPAVFAVWNKSDMTFVDLGPIIMALPSGFSRVAFFPGGAFILEHGDKMAMKYFGASPGGSLWYNLLAKRFNASSPGAKALPAVSFVVKELEKTRYLKIPYLLYFYVPLLIIFFLVVRYGLSLLLAFFYYLGLFFLFDYRQVFVTVPFDWLFTIFNLELSARQVEFAAVGLAAVFAFCTVIGFWHWKKSAVPGWAKKAVLVFALLPFVFFL